MPEYENVPAASTVRNRRRRARLRESGITVLTCQLTADIAEVLMRSAKLANVPPAHLAELIISKHFTRQINGPKRKPIKNGCDEEAT